MYGGKAISNKYVLSSYWVLGVISEDVIVILIASWFQIVGAATEKARLPILSVVLGTKRKLFRNGWSNNPRDIREMPQIN